MKPERNAPCPCGSGLKYKKCCLTKTDGVEFLWRRVGEASDSLDRKLIGYAQEKFDPELFLYAYDDLFGDPDGELVEPREEDLPFIGPYAFFHWFLSEEDEVKGLELPLEQPLSEYFIRQNKKKLSALEMNLFNQHQETPYSFFQVKSADPGQGFKATDLLVPREFYISEKKGSQRLSSGNILFGKVFQFQEGLNIMGTMAPWVIPSDFLIPILDLKNEIISETARHKQVLTIEDLNIFHDWVMDTLATIMGVIKTPLSERLRNTDGEEFCPTVMTYSISNPEKVCKLLSQLNLAESFEGIMEYAAKDKQGNFESVSFPWIMVPEGKEPGESNTVLAHLTITRGRLTAEMNSSERSDAFRKKMAELLPDEEYQLISVDTKSLDELNTDHEEWDEDEEGETLELNSPEAEALAKAMMEKHYREWPDTPLPALGNLTARQAVKDPAGREKVEALLEIFETKQARSPVMGLSEETFKNLRKELGL